MNSNHASCVSERRNYYDLLGLTPDYRYNSGLSLPCMESFRLSIVAVLPFNGRRHMTSFMDGTVRLCYFNIRRTNHTHKFGYWVEYSGRKE